MQLHRRSAREPAAWQALGPRAWGSPLPEPEPRAWGSRLPESEPRAWGFAVQQQAHQQQCEQQQDQPRYCLGLLLSGWRPAKALGWPVELPRVE